MMNMYTIYIYLLIYISMLGFKIKLYSIKSGDTKMLGYNFRIRYFA